MGTEIKLLSTITTLFPSLHLSHLCKVQVHYSPSWGSLHFIPGSSMELMGPGRVQKSSPEGGSWVSLGPGMNMEG